MTRRLTGLVVIGTTLLLMMAPAITLAAEEPPSDPSGIDWQLTGALVDGEVSAVPAGVTATLLLEDGQAGGSTGCNTFFGDYTLDAEALSFGDLNSTFRLCAPPDGDIEAAYLAALDEVASWAIDAEGGLSLADEAGATLLTFTSPSAATDDPLEGTVWLLQEQLVAGALQPVPEAVLVSLRLEDGAAGGSGGCNTYFATYVLDDGQISLSEPGSTLIACLDPAGSVEATYLANLASVASWGLEDGSLSLFAGDGTQVLVFDAAEPGSIVGSWVAQGINIEGGVVTSAATSAVTATFTEDGELSGDDGCNNYRATYQVDGQSIDIGQVLSTKMACANDELNAQSVAYQAALETATTWTVTPDGMLELRDADGALQVAYLPAEG